MVNLKGIFPPMITPFCENGAIDYDAFSFNAKRWGSMGMAGLLVLGSNGETAYLNEEEKLKLVKLTVEHAKDITVMAGTGLETAKATVDLTNQAADLGADCALILPPNFYDSAMTPAVLEEFFIDVADNSKIPILIYNVPKYTHVALPPALISKLADHPNIIGMKDSSGDIPNLASYCRATQEKDFFIMVGTAAALYPAMTLGIKGAVLALANSNPEECLNVYNLFCNTEYEKAYALYQKLFPLNAAVTATYGISGLKTACDLMGFKPGFS